MAKNKMQLKYKNKKRERNKNVVETTPKNSAFGFIKTLIGVLVFIGVMYLLVLGMKKLGVFEKGYTAPSKEAATISYEYIPVSTVFNRSDKEYFVLFDNYESSITSDSYINQLISNDKSHVYYKVDMSLKENAKVKGETANKNASNVSELSINDITLIKITNGKITMYLTGSESIEDYLE